MKNLDYPSTIDAIVEWLKNYSETSGQKGFTLGVSGGIDSAVVSTLCAKTELPVLILELPIHQSKDQVLRAKNHISWLKENFSNVESIEIDLTDVYDNLYNICCKSQGSRSFTRENFDFSMANTRSRLRMTTLYQFAGIHKMLVAGTGNKVEDFGIGFYTKWGDGAVDISPIGDLMKSEVYEIGDILGISSDILTAAPTDGLHGDSRTDEMQIGATYDELEWAMECCEENKIPSDNFLTERQIKVLNIYSRFNKSNKHKMEPIPVFNSSEYRN